MKSKFYYILFCILTIFSFDSCVYAKELEFTMQASASQNEVVVGSEATITVSLKSQSAIAMCQFNISADETLELVSKNGLNTWNFETFQGVGKITLHNNSLENVAYTEGKNIFNLVYKVNGDGKVVIKDIECTSLMPEGEAEDGSETEIMGTTPDISVNFTAKQPESDTSLSKLTVTGGKLLTEFSPNQYEYMIELETPNFSLGLTANNPGFQDKIVVKDVNGKTLNPQNITFSNDGNQGLMQMQVIVNGNTDKKYVLVAKYEQKELDNSLASLKINGTEVKLSADKTDYTFEVAANTSQVNIEAELKDSKNFQFRQGNEPGVFKLGSGNTSVALMIVPKSADGGGVEKTYTIEIVKKGGTPSGGNVTPPSSGGNATTNPSTGGISFFVMISILVCSFVGSVFIYRKQIANKEL